ncbi:MAG: hypothetical protein SGJ11_07285 [Phycisphaerae bacterium]|nr:hypothetical protein [Phycisphaerae bacterium]
MASDWSQPARTASRAAANGPAPVTPAQVADQFEVEVQEDRQHLARDGGIALVIGTVTALAVYALPILWLARRSVLAQGPPKIDPTIMSVLIAAIAVGGVVSFIWSWRAVRPTRTPSSRSSDPRYNRPKLYASSADDDDSDADPSMWADGLLFTRGFSFEELFAVGTRQFMLGVRSFVERARLDRPHLQRAAANLCRTGAPDGLPSASIPDDPATLLALTFLWQYRYLRSDGGPRRTRLRPSEKGRRVLAMEQRVP